MPGIARPRAARGDPHLLRAAPRLPQPHRRRRSSTTIPRPGGSTSPTSQAKLSARTAAVYFENPSYLGTIEADAAEIAALARAAGAETIVGRRPDLARRARAAGRLRRRHRRRQHPAARRAHVLRRRRRRLHRLARRGALRARVPDAEHLSISDTSSPASAASASRSSTRPRTASREEGNDWTGNSVYLWAIANADVHVAAGAARLRGGRRADPRTAATTRPARLGGDRRRARRAGRTGSSRSSSSSFDGAGKTVAEVNRRLRERGIFGGKDLSPRLPGARAERALLRHRGPQRRPTSTGSPTRSRRCSRDGSAATTPPSGTSRS